MKQFSAVTDVFVTKDAHTKSWDSCYREWKHKAFIEHLERAHETVKTWPEWKQQTFLRQNSDKVRQRN